MLPSIMVVTLKFLISSEKSLQVQLDYSVIINHIQLHENKFCLHICNHLKWEKRGRSVQPCDLGEMFICITFILNKPAENDLFGAALSGMCLFHLSFKLYSHQSILFELFCFLPAESLTWQVMFLILEIKLLSTTTSNIFFCILIG